MQVVKLKTIPDEVPSYGEMLKTNDILYSQNEVELSRGVLLETLDKYSKVKPLFISEVVKSVGKILDGTGYGEITINFQDGKATIIKCTEFTKIG